MFRAADEQTVLRWGYALVGLLFLLSAFFSADLARIHMTGLGTICGASEPHCGWCYATVGFALMGVAALAAAWRPIPAKARARAD